MGDSDEKPTKYTNFMSRFKELETLTSIEFQQVWEHYDSDGNGFIEGNELEGFFHELITAKAGAQAVPECAFEDLKTMFMEAYDENADGKIEMMELAQILRTEENFLLLFRHNQPLASSIEFMTIWRTYDADCSGFIEKEELKNFLKDLLSRQNAEITPEKLDEYTQTMIKLFDRNGDGKLELKELASLLPVKENFLLRFENKPILSRDDFEKVFSYYDKNNDGKIEGDELAGFLKDLMEHEKYVSKGIKPETQGGTMIDAKELEEYKRALLRICDINKDGTLQKAELRMILMSNMGAQAECSGN